MRWPLAARRSIFPDWLWLCDESSLHTRRALHIPAQILVGTILCEFGWICATGNAFMRQTVGRNSFLKIPSKIWRGTCRTLLLCSDDSSHSQSQSGKRLLLASRGHLVRRVAYQGTCTDLTHQSHTLDPTMKVSGARRIPASRLLIKDKNFFNFLTQYEKTFSKCGFTCLL